jgi:dihydrofolate reductase
MIRIEGYAIVSKDGMLANALGVMPDALKFKADQRFFEQGMDEVDVAIHGRHSHEGQPHSPERPRLIATRKVASISPDLSNPKARLWNPEGATLEAALAALGLTDARVGVVGGTDVFGLFLDRYDVFYLSRAPGVWLPGGRPVFPGVPGRTPGAVLEGHGLARTETRPLDAAKGLMLEVWRRAGGRTEATS